MSNTYQAIKGLGTGAGKLQVGLRSRLYQSPEHLLIVQSTGYTEDYKRVSYENIRYVVIRHTLSQQRQAMVSGGLFLLVSLLYLSAMPWIAVLVFSSPFAIWFIINVALGAGCCTYVNTDIQTVELPVPRRLKKVPILVDFLHAKTLPTKAPVINTA
jgi:hypothetical protein